MKHGTTQPPAAQDARPTLQPAGEVQSALSFVDFLATWYRLRFWFVGGLMLVGLGALIWNKFCVPKYYRAEARIFVGRAIPLEQRIGFADLEGTAIGRNDQFLNLVQAVLAEQYLTSTNLLLDVTDRFLSGDFTTRFNMQKWNLYELLKIREKEPDFRRRKLAAMMQANLIAVRQVQNSGLLVFSVELPNPEAASQFTNACIRVLQDRFTELEFDYFDRARELYQRQIATEIKESQRLAESRVNIDFDKYPPRAQQNEILKSELEHQATWIGELNTKISKLGLATSEAAKLAAQPVKVVDYASIPLKKSRPKTILNTLMASALYTFMFMLGLAVYGYVRWSLAARRPEA